MTVCRTAFIVVALLLGTLVISLAQDSRMYEAEWASLETHETPEWFQDARFGINTHWGPITYITQDAPSLMEWYARQMYQPDHPAFEHHREKRLRSD